MWKTINSPIVIAVICLIAFGLIIRPSKLKLASEIRGLYEELMKIAEEGSSDAEKTKAIRDFSKEIAAQIRTGFSAGFKTPDSGKKKKSDDQIFIEIQDKIFVSDFSTIESRYQSREEFMYKITNNSDRHIKQIKVNMEFYKDNKLIDCKNKWVSEIKILGPGKEITVRGYRDIAAETKEEKSTKLSDVIKGAVTNFIIVKVK